MLNTERNAKYRKASAPYPKHHKSQNPQTNINAGRQNNIWVNNENYAWKEDGITNPQETKLKKKSS